MIQCLELALKCVQLFTKNQTHLVLKAKTSDCGLSSPLMKCRQLSRSNWIATKDLRNFRGCALGRVFELRFGILTRFEVRSLKNRQYLPARNNWHMVLKMKVSLRLAKW